MFYCLNLTEDFERNTFVWVVEKVFFVYQTWLRTGEYETEFSEGSKQRGQHIASLLWVLTLASPINQAWGLSGLLRLFFPNHPYKRWQELLTLTSVIFCSAVHCFGTFSFAGCLVVKLNVFICYEKCPLDK